MHPIAKPSCAIVLFFYNKHNIQSYCGFRDQINAIKPSVIHINEGRYLLSNVTNIYLRCPSGMRQVKGCKFCVFTVPCFCDISTDAVHFPPRLNHCEDDATKATVVHPVNLAVLTHFHDEELLYHINGDSLFQAPLAAPTPKINIFHHNFSEFIAFFFFFSIFLNSFKFHHNFFEFTYSYIWHCYHCSLMCCGCRIRSNLVDKSELKIPYAMLLSPIKALKLRKILGDNYFVYLVVMHGQHALHIKVCPLQCQRCIIDLDVVENSPENSSWRYYSLTNDFVFIIMYICV